MYREKNSPEKISSFKMKSVFFEEKNMGQFHWFLPTKWLIRKYS